MASARSSSAGREGAEGRRQDASSVGAIVTRPAPRGKAASRSTDLPRRKSICHTPPLSVREILALLSAAPASVAVGVRASKEIGVVRYSLLVPISRGAVHFERQLPALVDVLKSLDPAHEILCLDDASGEADSFTRLVESFPSVRCITLPTRSGTSACLSAGVAAAQGETLIVIEAGERYSADDIPRLVERLARADLVCGRRRSTRWQKALLATRHLPRRLLLGGDVHDPNCLFWAARREAVAGLPPAPGLWRHLATWVAMRGFRIGEAYVDHRRTSHPSTTTDRRARPGDLFGIWWQARRWRAQSSAELAAEDEHARLARRQFRGGTTTPRLTTSGAPASPEPEHRFRRSA